MKKHYLHSTTNITVNDHTEGCTVNRQITKYFERSLVELWSKYVP